jgi:hypothetical protein
MAQDNQVKNDYGLFNISQEHLSPSEPAEAFLEQYRIYLGQSINSVIICFCQNSPSLINTSRLRAFA